MNLGRILLLTLVVFGDMGSSLASLKNVTNSVAVPPKITPKVQLITDIINGNKDENVIIIGHLDDLMDLSRLTSGMGNIIILQVAAITNRMTENLKALRINDNKSSFYIILPDIKNTDESVNELISNIRSINAEDKIAVVYDDPVDVKELYEDKNIYNIYLFIPNSPYMVKEDDDALYKMFQICMFCNEGEDIIQLSNTWKVNSGFRRKIKFDKSFNGNFHGSHATMSIDENFPPNFFIASQNENGTKIYDGVTYKFYVAIADVLNMTWKFVPNRYGSGWSFSSYLRDLDDGYVDAIGSGWTSTYERYKEAGDMSTGERYYDGDCIISIEPQKNLRQNAIYRAFDIYIWILLLASIPAAGVVLYISRRRAQQPDEPANISQCLWEVVIIICWETVRIKEAPWSVILIFGAFMFMAFITISLYFGAYTALVTI